MIVPSKNPKDTASRMPLVGKSELKSETVEVGEFSLMQPVDLSIYYY